MTLKMPKALWIVLVTGLTIAVIFFSYLFWKFNEIKNTQTYFDNLDEALKNPAQVTVLIIRNQELTSLPEELKRLTNLRVLNLANNKLTDLPESIGSLFKLEELCLDNNFLVTLPSSFKNLKKLRLVSASNNRFVEIPENVYQLEELKILNLARNKIQRADVGAFKKIEDLDLSENCLNELSFPTQRSSAIKRLDLYNNKLVTVPPKVFEITRLNELILSGNELDHESKTLYEKFLKVKQ